MAKLSAQKKGTLTTDQQIEAMNFDLVSQRDSELQREKVVVFKLVNSNRKRQGLSAAYMRYNSSRN